jgi:hypothetical protein
MQATDTVLCPIARIVYYQQALGIKIINREDRFPTSMAGTPR